MSHNIFVGVGGTGAKSLLELAKNLAEDEQWRTKAEDEVSFLLIDTDKNDLTKLKNAIMTSLALDESSIYTLHLTQKHNTLIPIMNRWASTIRESTHMKGGSEEALKRFAERWWFTDYRNPSFNNRVFTAPKVRNLTEGASQVPAVSYMMTWQSVDRLKRILKSLFTKIRAKNNPADVTTYFVGSLAGGTGRGALATLGFLFNREWIRAVGNRKDADAANSYLYGLDYSCFTDLESISEDQILNMRINSYTGWSELSAWHSLKNRENAETVEVLNKSAYYLPSLQRPGDPENDCISFKNVAAEAGHVGIQPFKNIFSIFGESDGPSRRHPSQAYRLVADGIFSRMNIAGFQSAETNEGRLYASVGTSSAFINGASIESYYNKKAKADLFTSLIMPSNDQELEQRAEKEGQKLWTEFFGENLLVSIIQVAEEDVSYNVQDSGLSLFSRFLMGVRHSDYMTQSIEALNYALEKDKLDEVNNIVAEHFNSESILQSGETLSWILDVFEKSLQEHSKLHPNKNWESLGDWQTGLISSLVGGNDVMEEDSLFGSSKSAVLIEKVAKKLLDEFAKMDSELSVYELENQEGGYAMGLDEVVQEGGAKKDFFFFGRRFNETECAQIVNAARQRLIFSAVEVFADLLNNNNSELGKLKTSLETIELNASDMASAARQCVDLEVVKELEDTRKKLFILRDQDGKVDRDSLLSQLNADTEGGSQFRDISREIRPIEPLTGNESKREEGILLLSLGNAFKTLSEMLLERCNERDPQEEMRKRLQGKVLDSVKYLFMEEVDKFISGTNPKTFFEMSNTLREHYYAWKDYIKSQQNSPNIGRICREFYKFYGCNVRLKDRSDVVEINTGYDINGVSIGDQMVMAMAASLVASTSPAWRNSAPDNPVRACILPIPAPSGRAEIKNAISAQTGDVEVLLQYNDGAFDRNMGKKVMRSKNKISIYVTDGCQGLDDILTLDSWAEGFVCKQVLARFEDLAMVPPVFATVSGSELPPDNPFTAFYDEYMGSGFADPIYVQSQVLRKYRWRPWYDQQEDYQQKALTVIYSLWGARGFLEGTSVCEKATEYLQSVKFPEEPSFQQDKNGNISFSRFPYESSSGGEFRVRAKGISVREGAVIQQSTANFVGCYLGTVKPRYANHEAVRILLEAVEHEYREFVKVIGDVNSGKDDYKKVLENVRDKANKILMNSESLSEGDRRVYDQVIEYVDNLEKS